MSEPKEWTFRVTVTDYGRWDPEDEAACAAVIARVNKLRRPDNRRPKIRRDDWGDRLVWLDAEIEDTSIRINPGEHLIRSTYPGGSEWVAVTAEDLADVVGLR
jgi:hypothetical protein